MVAPYIHIGGCTIYTQVSATDFLTPHISWSTKPPPSPKRQLQESDHPLPPAASTNLLIEGKAPHVTCRTNAPVRACRAWQPRPSPAGRPGVAPSQRRFFSVRRRPCSRTAGPGHTPATHPPSTRTASARTSSASGKQAGGGVGAGKGCGRARSGAGAETPQVHSSIHETP